MGRMTFTEPKCMYSTRVHFTFTFTVYFSGYTETDTTGMFSPINGLLSGANNVGLFRTDSLTTHLLQCALTSSYFAMDSMSVIENV
jgi:hypothetical protein